MSERKTLVNKDGREVYVDTAEAETAFRSKGYVAKGESFPEPEPEPDDTTGKGGGKPPGKPGGKDK